MLQGQEDNQLIYMDFVCANGHLTNSLPSSTENIKIALPPASTTYIFTQIHLPGRVHSVVMRTAALRQLAGARAGKDKVHEAGTDYFGTAAEISLVKLA